MAATHVERERETTLLTEEAVQFATAKTFVFSDSVLCLRGISPEPVGAWESKIRWFMESRYFRVLGRIDGEPMEFEWKFFSGFTTLGILDETQKMMTELMCEPKHLQGRIIFMSTMTLIGKNEETMKIVLRMLTELLNMLENSCEDIGHFQGGTELTYATPTDKGTKLLRM